MIEERFTVAVPKRDAVVPQGRPQSTGGMEPASRLPCRCEIRDPRAPAVPFGRGKAIAEAGRLPLTWPRTSHLSRHVAESADIKKPAPSANIEEPR